MAGNLELRPPESPFLSAAPAEQFRSLDGLRAASITLVLLDHLGIPWRGQRLDLGVGDYGHLGVVIFFVISGFLITSLLVTERNRKGRVSLTRFYARRALRIFPAAYCYIACVFGLGLMGYVVIPTRDFAAAVTYTENFLPDPIWLYGHLWSLSVEEQFYLMWPAAFAALALRRATGVAVTVMLLGPLARAAAWILFRETPYGDVPMFPMVADSLAAGCLLAIWRSWFEGRKWYMRLLQPIPSLILVALVLILNRLTGYGVVEIFGRSVENIAIAILIHRSIHHSWDAAGRFLNASLPAFVGRLSYSLYLWQQLFLDRHSSSWYNLFPQNLVLTLLTALASYYLLEKPVMALRHRLRA